jgi:hypothetical protein
MKFGHNRSLLLVICTGAALFATAADARTHVMPRGTAAPGGAAAGPRDSLYLNPSQQQIVRSGLGNSMASQIPPDAFSLPGVGAAIPPGVNTQAIPGNVAARVPALRPYQYTLVYGKVLIVNPKDHHVVEVIPL